MKTLTKGQKFEITRNHAFGKTGKEIITIVAILGNKVLFDNGMELHKAELI